jgi:hypothetical protein
VQAQFEPFGAYDKTGHLLSNDSPSMCIYVG